jgi:hypothetical protein
MSWKKLSGQKDGPEILEHYTIGNLEITRVQTSKPIKPAKAGIRIDNLKNKK